MLQMSVWGETKSQVNTDTLTTDWEGANTLILRRFGRLDITYCGWLRQPQHIYAADPTARARARVVAAV